MKSHLAIVLLSAFFLAAITGAEVDRSTPETTVKSFFKALAESNYNDLVACVKGAKHNENLARMIRQSDDFPQLRVDVIDVKIDGTKATCTARIIEPAKEARGDHPLEKVNLELVDGNWQIVAPKGEPDLGHFINGLAKALLMPDEVFASAREAAKKAACLSNIKQLATALLIVAADNGDVIKVKADSWKKAVMPYLKYQGIFTCPLDAKGAFSYSINPAMAGIGIAKIKQPAKTVLLYEGSKGKLNFRHGGSAAVAYADGHVKMVNAETAKNLNWKP